MSPNAMFLYCLSILGVFGMLAAIVGFFFMVRHALTAFNNIGHRKDDSGYSNGVYTNEDAVIRCLGIVASFASILFMFWVAYAAYHEAGLR